MTYPTIESVTSQLGLGNRRLDIDIEHLKPEHTVLQQAQRIAIISLPLLALYKPLGSVISIGMNISRDISSLINTKEAFTKDSKTMKDKEIAIFQTIIASATVIGFIFSKVNVYAMALTSGYDLLVNLYEMVEHIEKGRKNQAGEYEKAVEMFLGVVCNSLYLIMLLQGSLEIILISFAAQLLLEAYKTQGLLRKYMDSKKEDRDILDLLDGFAHLGMTGIRGYQMHSTLQMLQFKWKLEKIIEEQTSKKRQKETSEESKTMSSPKLSESQMNKNYNREYYADIAKKIILNKTAFWETHPYQTAIVECDLHYYLGVRRNRWDLSFGNFINPKDISLDYVKLNIRNELKKINPDICPNMDTIGYAVRDLFQTLGITDYISAENRGWESSDLYACLEAVFIPRNIYENIILPWINP